MLLSISSFLCLSAAAIPTLAHPTGGRSLDDLANERPPGATVPNTTRLFQNVTQICGTRDPSDELVQAHADFLERSRRQQGKTKRRQASPPIEVQLYIHFVSTTDQMNHYPSGVRTAMIEDQVSVLTTLYRPFGIAFNLLSTTFTVNDAWATDAASLSMKRALRRGTYASLNIYFQTNLSSAPYSSSGSSSTALLGYCTLPTNITYPADGGEREEGELQEEYPSVDYAADGCDVLAGSMPKAPVGVEGYGLGKTAVHEVGHWFGLLHTFQDNTCATADPGDYCDDTPQESQSTTGCPRGKDSCPGSPGLDPISNYMDYSTDACYSTFSPDQSARMKDMFEMFRMGY